MRMEELSNSQYIKNTDTVEKYLLSLVRLYFRDSNIADVNSREYVIRRAVERMKEEFKFENIGVLSVTVNGGEEQTGTVNITLSDLNGEPAISPKRSAFNVDFGNKNNTACEGNDPRLSDARPPLPHTHSIQDINGLEGRLSSLLSAITRTDAYAHEHENLDILDKLIYTGTSPTIDLNIIETLPQEINQKVSEVRSDIDDLINNIIPQKLAQIQRDLDNTASEIQKAENTTGTVHEGYLRQAKNYADSQIPNALNEFNGCFDGYITEDQLSAITVEAMSYVGSMKSSMNNATHQTPSGVTDYYYYSAKISDDILNELMNRDVPLEECIIDILVKIKHVSSNGESKYEWTQTPYLYMSDSGDIIGTLVTGVDFENKNIWFSYRTASSESTLPDEVKNTNIEIKFYAKRKAI